MKQLPHPKVNALSAGIAWPSWCVLLGSFCIILSSKLFLIKYFGSAIPFWDQWDGEGAGLLVPFLEGKLDWSQLLAAHNEHRIALTRLLVLGLFVLNGQWDPLLAMVAQAALHALLLAILVAQCRAFLPQQLWLLFAGTIAITYIIPFSWENTLWGFQSQFYFALLCGCLGIWFTSQSPYLSIYWWLGYAFFVLAPFTMGSAFLAAAAALTVGLLQLYLLRTQRYRTIAALLFLTFAVCAGFLLLGYNPGHDPYKAQNAREFLSLFFLLSAWPTSVPVFGIVLYGPVLAIGLYVILRKPPRENSVWLLLTLGSWSVLSMAALAYGRANSGVSSRYTDGLAFGIMVSVASSLWFSAHLRDQWKKLAIAYVALQIGILFGGLIHEFFSHDMKAITERKAMEKQQAVNINAFLASNSVDTLENRPHDEISYPGAMRLAEVLRIEKLQEILPSAIQQGLSPTTAFADQAAFLRNVAIPGKMAPVNAVVWFSSYARSGNTNLGTLRLNYTVPPILVHRLSLQVAGYPSIEPNELFIETASGKRIAIRFDEEPGETWRNAVFRNPAEPFSIVAVDRSPTRWLAVSLPKPVGNLSLLALRFMNMWWALGSLGLVCFVAAAFASQTQKRAQSGSGT